MKHHTTGHPNYLCHAPLELACARAPRQILQVCLRYAEAVSVFKSLRLPLRWVHPVAPPNRAPQLQGLCACIFQVCALLQVEPFDIEPESVAVRWARKKEAQLLHEALSTGAAPPPHPLATPEQLSEALGTAIRPR